MTKSNNTPKLISETYYGPVHLNDMRVIDVYTLHNWMVDNNILSVFNKEDYYGHNREHNKLSRMETQLEADVRYAKELKQYEKEKEQQKITKEKQIEKLKKEAKKLGLSVS